MIEAYRAVVSREAVGYEVMALVGITTNQPAKVRLIAKLRQMPEVLECHHVTGQDSYVFKVVTRNIRHLEELVGSINQFGETRTSIVMSTPIPPRSLARPATHEP